MFGHDAVLPIEVELQTIHVAKQCKLPIEDYWNGMIDELNELEQDRLDALENIVRQKESMSCYYNRRVKNKTFQLADLVWKTILPFEKTFRTHGKWSLTSECPFQVTRAFLGNAYGLVDVVKGAKIKFVNDKYLKIYKPICMR